MGAAGQMPDKRWTDAGQTQTNAGQTPYKCRTNAGQMQTNAGHGQWGRFNVKIVDSGGNMVPN
jgi:hypothetical protein